MTHATAKDPSSARTVARKRRARNEKIATRELLLESARTILRQGALFDLTAISLGNHSGVTRQTVYRYFPSTESIFKALSDQVITQVYEDLQLPSENEDALDHFVTKAISVFVGDSMVIRQCWPLRSAAHRVTGIRWILREFCSRSYQTCRRTSAPSVPTPPFPRA